ncbi:MAG: hypothetical protein PHT95_00240 [Candidatus Omnitrophica bacterium]|nr:hypothetical protein [Candidatus Omnitrophota bacterium]MDD4013038.1 hypothetical protein [Candidatus Omnitrophota bacterium]
MVLIVDHDMEGTNVLAFNKDGSSRVIPIGAAGSVCDAEKLGKRVRAVIGKGRVRAISFRILFGGDCFDGPAIINEDFFEKFERLTEFFPFYVPRTIELLKKFSAVFRETPLIAFFETSFFKTLPDEEKYYALPIEYCENNRIRKWGFNGIFHEANANALPSGMKIVSIVFDKQTTVCAIRDDAPLSISLGYTPLEGVMSRTSCGDLDPGIVFYLMNVHKYSLYRIDEVLKNESGFTGMTGYDIKMEDMLKLLGRDAKVNLAFDVYRSQIMKYIGEGISVLGGLDGIVFSGSSICFFHPVIHDILKRISFLGINVASLPWGDTGEMISISSGESKIKAYINRMDIAKIVCQRTENFLSVLPSPVR